jgi:hypothetical protein
VGVESVVLGLGSAAGPLVVPVAEALRDEAPGGGGAGCLEQVVEPLSAKAIGECELLVELPEALDTDQRRHLMDDDLRLSAQHGGHNGGLVEAVRDDRLGSQIAHQASLVAVARHGDNLMSVCHQDGNEAPAEPPGRACNENLHRCLLLTGSLQAGTRQRRSQ